MADAQAIASSLITSFDNVFVGKAPYRYGVPDPLLPVAPPVIGDTLGKRETHNTTRWFFGADARAKHPGGVNGGTFCLPPRAYAKESGDLDGATHDLVLSLSKDDPEGAKAGARNGRRATRLANVRHGGTPSTCAGVRFPWSVLRQAQDEVGVGGAAYQGRQ